MTISVGGPFMGALLHGHFLGKVLSLFCQQTIVVFSKVARLLPKLAHLGVFSLGSSPDAFPCPFVALSIFFDALLNLSLVNSVWDLPFPRLGCCLGRGPINHFHIAGRGRNQSEVVVVGLALAQYVLDLGDGLRLEVALALQALQNLCTGLKGAGTWLSGPQTRSRKPTLRTTLTLAAPDPSSGATASTTRMMSRCIMRM